MTPDEYMLWTSALGFLGPGLHMFWFQISVFCFSGWKPRAHSRRSGMQRVAAGQPWRGLMVPRGPASVELVV